MRAAPYDDGYQRGYDRYDAGPVYPYQVLPYPNWLPVFGGTNGLRRSRHDECLVVYSLGTFVIFSSLE
jgi:hypothetical protein